jgi:hypothetical protein
MRNTDYRYDCVSKTKSDLGQGNILNGKRALALRKNLLESTSYLLPLPVKPVSLNVMQNHREHQLSSVCPVVPIWLAVK